MVYVGGVMAAPVPIPLSWLRGLHGTSPARATFVILASSAAVLAALLGVIYGHGRAASIPAWIGWLPAFNAACNAVSATFLVLAYRAIRRRDAALHARRILVSLAASTLFLVSYIVYHSVCGDTHFTGEGPIRAFYFVVLVSHVVLSAVVLPLVFLSLFFSLSGRFARHRAIARYTLPAWLYVSVTGVLVFVLLRAFG